jgi:hypothetical protein
LTDDSVVADAVTPEGLFFTLQGFAGPAGVCGQFEALAEKPYDSGLDLMVEFGDLLLGCSSDFNAPCQGVAPTRRDLL